MDQHQTLDLEAVEPMTAREVADFLKVHIKTLLRWHAQGVGPRRYCPTGRGGRALYNRAEVIAWAFREKGGSR
ncbi:helix-turn-helix domain-containing protein [Engelhardtia mirabilis]|uniref:Helix-turn-helix domain protein n=1 Tax=Engelhardtia mirabilis TaxID=2528011 RepID=A0A518BK26_9BACT|nr:Helix-turn-helix domain protein [Planctomycetes bacterium Pla133]QDV01656.1 Helix-turn-helix domain protein [Planctomycetes bacterium Pla86]